MPPAPLPADESTRLEALRSYKILDTLPEQEYDDIVGIASRICETPIALISLVDENRQWFKAQVGVEVKETPRDAAFCAHAILHQTEMLLVRDATSDPRFSDNPLVTGEPYIRFYAGSPLITPSGDALGTLCVIDSEPKELTADQRLSLQALARQTAALLELRGHAIRLDDSQEKLQTTNDALNEFAYAASHDLKQPIRGVGAVTDFLLEDHGDELSPEALEKLGMIKDLSKRSLMLLDQMLHYARVGCTLDEQQEVVLNDIVAYVRQDLFALIKANNVEFLSDDLPTVMGEPVLLNELFQNLVSNGIKYNDSAEKQIRIGHHQYSPGFGQETITAFYIADNGLGIPAELHSDVFTIFRRLHAGDEYGGGSGAGLTIAKKIVENHRGEIWIDSGYKSGTCFWFTLGKIPSAFKSHFRYEDQLTACV